MPTYTVECDTCSGHFTSSHSYNISDTVEQCKWCGSDCCPKCDRIGSLHSDCHKAEQDFEKDFEDDGN